MNRSKEKRGANKYMKYTAIGSEMLAACIFGVLVGQWLDEKIAIGFPLFTIGLILLGLLGAFIHLLRQLEADRKADESENQWNHDNKVFPK